MPGVTTNQAASYLKINAICHGRLPVAGLTYQHISNINKHKSKN